MKREFQRAIVVALGILLGNCSFKPHFPLERTKARLEWGRYLVENALRCFRCHSEQQLHGPDAGQPVPGMKGGGVRFSLAEPRYTVYVPNISPDVETGAGKWSDEDFYRALTRGTGHDGRPLHPLMPYYRYRAEIADEDIASIIVYVRSIPPVRNALPKNAFPESVKANMKTLRPRLPVRRPDWNDRTQRAANLLKLADCEGCHTPERPGLHFAGGRIFDGPSGRVASANLTPDPSGIAYYDEKLFISVIRTGRNGARELNAVMPWAAFKYLTDDDLLGLFAALRKLKPVAHRVDNTEVPTECKRCGNRHGLGWMNGPAK